MSILTKTLVVLVTITSIVLVALVVPLVATQDDRGAQIQDLKVQLGAAKAANEVLESEIAAAQKGEAATIANLRTELGNKIADNIAEKAARLKAENAAKTAQNALVEIKASLATMTGTAQENVKLLNLTTDQLTKSQETIQTQGTRIIQLSDEIDEVKSERATLARMVRNLQEQMVALQEERDEAVTTLALIPPEEQKKWIEGVQAGTGTVLPGDGVTIVGQVLEVQELNDGLTLVQVNIGESDKVQEGMKFLVHKDNEFKGTLIISRVEPRLSVGKMELVKSAPLAGDSVYIGPY